MFWSRGDLSAPLSLFASFAARSGFSDASESHVGDFPISPSESGISFPNINVIISYIFA